MQLTRVDDLPTEPAELAGVLTGCPLTLVSLDQLTDAGQPGVDRTDEGTDPQARAAALQRIDRAVGQLRAAVATLDGDTLVILAGISEVNDGRPQLHVGMVVRARLRPHRMADLGEHRPGAVRAAHRPGPDGAGRARPGPAGVDERPADAVHRTAAGAGAGGQQLDDANTAATVHHRNTGVFFWSLVLVSAALVALGMLVLGGLRGVRPGARTPDAVRCACWRWRPRGCRSPPTWPGSSLGRAPARRCPHCSGPCSPPTWS